MSILCLDAAARFTATFARSSPKDMVPGDGADRVTIIGAAHMCAVSMATVHQWVITGLWPLPCVVCDRKSFFNRSDVKRWLASGEWPDGAHFRRQQAGARRKRCSEAGISGALVSHAGGSTHATHHVMAYSAPGPDASR